MRLEKYPVKKIKKELLEIFKRHTGLRGYRFFFFGSRVTGKGNARSDIDVGIEGPEEVPAKIMDDLREEVEKLPVLYKIELVDFKKVSPEFKKISLKKIELIN